MDLPAGPECDGSEASKLHFIKPAASVIRQSFAAQE